jgi:hypothetical protein
MKILNRCVAGCLVGAMCYTSPAIAQVRTVDSQALSAALSAHADGERAQRATVQRVLERDDVRAVAARLGLDMTQAASAVATMSGPELASASQQATAVESSALAGGASTLVISTTTLLIVIIIVILLSN